METDEIIEALNTVPNMLRTQLSRTAEKFSPAEMAAWTRSWVVPVSFSPSPLPPLHPSVAKDPL